MPFQFCATLYRDRAEAVVRTDGKPCEERTIGVVSNPHVHDHERTAPLLFTNVSFHFPTAGVGRLAGRALLSEPARKHHCVKQCGFTSIRYSDTKIKMS